MQSAEQAKNNTPADRRKRGVRWVFTGSNGIRAGWGIVLFIAICAAVVFGMAKLLHYFFGHVPHSRALMTLKTTYLGECVQLLGLVTALSVLATIERRPMLSFGLQGYARFVRFAAGLVCGFGAISVTVFVLVQLHVLTLDAPSAHGPEMWSHASGWAGVFLLVGLCEESALRGYLQYTLTRGIGFWWGALLLSALFGGIHGVNPGETPVGLFAAAGFGVVLCLSLWYTGSLFWAIGFHAAWDWGESYFYGTSDSGTLVDTRLFTAHPMGNVLLSGGSTGPEGSMLIFPLLGVLALLMWLWWGRRVTPPFGGSAWKPGRG
jgi:membrane protease YdiL (CAAX protease family)